MNHKRCERCRTALVEIKLNVADGRMTMRSCSRCDRRFWLVDGEPAELGGVLEQIGSTRR